MTYTRTQAGGDLIPGSSKQLAQLGRPRLALRRQRFWTEPDLATHLGAVWQVRLPQESLSSEFTWRKARLRRTAVGMPVGPKGCWRCGVTKTNAWVTISERGSQRK